MTRTLLWCAALALCALPSWADQSISSTETVIRLTVYPMAAPKPALRYLLLPELRELNPGNPIPNYLKCNIDPNPEPNREIGRAALRLADRAARLDKPDWQILQKVKTDGIGLLLPDVQKIRALAAALQGRFREEVALGHFDDALGTAKTMFAMSRHMAEHPTLIGDLVGIAIAFVAIGPLEEMLEQPGCPNLYWALTNMPNPLVPLDKGIEAEKQFLVSEFHELESTTPLSSDQLNQLIAHIDKVRKLENTSNKNDKNMRAWLNARVKDEKLLSDARRRLVEYGLREEQVARFPAEQVVLLDQKREYEVHRDEVMKLMHLPAWQVEAMVGRDKSAKEPTLFEFFLPAVPKVRRAQARLEQRIALLRHVEALRLYAAEHDGRLPEKLDDVPVPLPADPFTGKPFGYKVDGATAHLRGSPPPGEENNPGFNVRYEVTIQK
jgi:hypothetical protein